MELDKLAQDAPQLIAALGGLGVARRLFGASLDEIGESLRRVTAWKLRNVGRVVDAAERKSINQAPDSAPPLRASLAILEQATVAEDAIMADYLGGVLAAARAQGSDEAVVWTALIGRMSSAELRLHYVLYAALREIVVGLDLNLGDADDRRKLRFFVPMEGERGLLASAGVAPFLAGGSTVFGTLREGLFDEGLRWAIGDRDAVLKAWPEAPGAGCVLTPSPQGILLFLWGMGAGHLGMNAFRSSVELAAPLDQIRVPTAVFTSPGFGLDPPATTQ